MLGRYDVPYSQVYWLALDRLPDIMGPITHWQMATLYHSWQQPITHWQTLTNPNTPPLGFTINHLEEVQENALQQAADFRYLDKIYQWLQTHNPKALADKTQDQIAQQKIVLFPVRYAIDESPDERNQPQKHPIPKEWGATGQPQINTRDYCLRQLRDGWIYVWDGKKFDEYRIKGKNFTHSNRKDKTLPVQPMILQDTQVVADEKGTKSYLEYQANQTIYLAYSQERWTEHLYQTLQKNQHNERQTWMRPIELSMLCLKTQPHTHLIKDIANYVADIYQDSIAPNDSFNTTTVPYQSADAQADSKAPQLSATIVGVVPEKETAYFVALEDPLGIINDLTLQLTGRNLALLNFNKTHQHKLYTAQVVKALAGTTLEEKDYPTGVTTTADKQRFERELEQCLYEVDDATNALKLAGDTSYMMSEQTAKDVWNQSATIGMMTLNSSPITNAFKAKYARETKYNAQWFVEKFKLWESHAKSRRQVKYPEATGYLVHEIEYENIQQHINENTQDLIKYLDFTGNNPYRVFLIQPIKANVRS